MKDHFFIALGLFLAVVLVIAQNQTVSARSENPGLPGIDETEFILDQAALDGAMQELNALDSYLDQNEGTTFAELASSGSNLVKDFSEEPAPMGMAGEYSDLLGIPPFFWGCVLGWVGIVLVYVLSENKAFAKKALIGALVWTLLALIAYFAAGGAAI